MRLANGGLELEGLALPIKGGSLHIETLRLGLLSVHVRGVRLKTALPDATNSNGLAKPLRRLAARLVQVSVEGPIEVTITSKDGEVTATAAACTLEHQTLRAPAVSVAFEGAEAALRELTVSADGASASELTATASAECVARAKALVPRTAPPEQQLPWASLALVAALLAWWPLMGVVLVALWALSVYMEDKPASKKPYELGAARVAVTLGKLHATATKLRVSGSKVRADAATCILLQEDDEVLCVRATDVRAAGLSIECESLNATVDPRAFPRDDRQPQGNWRLELAVKREVEVTFVKADCNGDKVRRALLTATTSSALVEPGSIQLNLAALRVDDGDGRNQVQGSMIAFRRRKAEIAVQLRGGSVVYEHRFVADVLRWFHAARTVSNDPAPSLKVDCSDVDLVVPESMERRGAATFSINTLKGRRGDEALILIEADCRLKCLGEECGRLPSLNVRIVKSRVDVALARDALSLRLTRAQYACLVGLFFGNVGDDHGDGSTEKWWPETDATATEFPQNWYERGTAPHALSKTLGFAWRVRVACPNLSIALVDCDCSLETVKLRLDVDRVAQGGGCASSLVLETLRVINNDENWLTVQKRNDAALRYEHRTNVKFTWAGVYLGRLDLRAVPSDISSLCAFLWGGFKRASRLAPIKRPDAVSPRRETHAASLVVDVVNASYAIGELVCTLDRVKFVRDASLVKGEASLEGRIDSIIADDRTLSRAFDVTWKRTATYEGDVCQAEASFKVDHIDLYGDRHDLRRCRDVVALLKRPRPPIKGDAHAWALLVDAADPPELPGRTTFTGEGSVILHALRAGGRRRVARGLLNWRAQGAAETDRVACNVDIKLEASARPEKSWAPVLDRHGLVIALESRHGGRARSCRIVSAEPLHASLDVKLVEALRENDDRPERCCSIVCRHRINSSSSLDAFLRLSGSSNDFGGTVQVQADESQAISHGEDSGDEDEDDDTPSIVVDALSVETEHGKWVLNPDDYGGAAPVLLEGSTPLRLRRNDEVALCSATCERVGPRLILTVASRFSVTNKGDEALDIRCGGFEATVGPDSTIQLPLIPETANLEARLTKNWIACGRVGASNTLKRLEGGLCRGGTDQSIVLRPALTLKNALPCAVAWEAAVNGVRKGCLHATEQVSLYTDAEKATLRLRVANYQWSRGVAFDTNQLVEASSSSEGVVSRTDLILDALDARVESDDGERWVRVAPSLRVTVSVDAAGLITLSCRYALENLLEAPCSYAPAEIPDEAQRVLAVQQLGVATGLSRRPSLSRRSSGRRRMLSSVRSISKVEDKEPDTPRMEVTLRRAAHHERFVKIQAKTAREAVRKVIPDYSDEYDVVGEDTHPMDLDAPLLEPCTLYLRHRLERALAQQDALDLDQLYPSEAAAAAAVAVPWSGAMPWDPVAGGPRRHGPQLATRALLTHGPAPSRGEATARIRVDGCSEWSAPLVLPTRYDNKLEGTALRFDDDADEAADGASTRLQLRAPERSQRRPVYDLSLRVEACRDYVGVVLTPKLSFRNHTDGVLEVRQAGVDVDRPLLELQPKETGQVIAWSDEQGPRLVQLRLRRSDDAILKSGALRADCLVGRGETVFAAFNNDHEVHLRLRREARSFTDDNGDDLSTGIETLCIVEESDERWPPYRLVNKTDIKLRYRQRLAKQNFPKEVADFDGELSTVKDTSFTLASLNHQSKPRGPRSIIVQPRNDQKKQGLKVTGNDDEAPDDEIGNASKFVKQSSMSSELERAASSMSSAVFGSTSKPPTSASDALERGVKYLGKKARSGARKVGLLEAKRAEQRVGPWRSLEPGDSASYAWERPLDAVGSSTRSQRRVLIVEGYTDKGWTQRVQVALDEAQGELKGDLPCVVKADGPTRVLEFGSRTTDVIRPDLSATEDGGDRLVAHAAELGASILIRGLDDKPRELVKITLCDARAAWTCLEQGGVNAEFSIHHVQVDNLLSPRPLYAAALRPRLGEDDSPCLAASVRRRTDGDLTTIQHAVTYLDRFVVRARPLDVHLDHEVAALLVALYADCSRSADEDIELQSTLVKTTTTQRRRREVSRLVKQRKRPAVFCAQVRLHPVDARVTLKGGLTPLTRKEVARACGNTSVDAVSAAVGQLDTAQLKVDALYLDDALARTAEGLGRRVARHYLQTLLKQAHRVCGSLDIVRAPMSAASSLGGGVMDLVYQPVQGASTGGASGLASGVARGSASAVGGAFDAATGVVSSVTASTGSALAALTMDSSYQTSRATRRAQEANKARGASGSSTTLADSVQKHSKVAAEVVRGAQDLGGGIFEGVTGIVVEPYKSISRGDDAIDVAKATARGLVGVAIKPAVGVVDMTTRAVEGVRTAGKYANDSFQSAVSASLAAKKLKRRSSISEAPWRRKARLDPHCPWSRLSHSRMVLSDSSFRMLDAEAAEAQQCLRLTSDSDERHSLQLRYGAALDNFGDVRWFGQRTHSIEYCSDDDGDEDTSGNMRRKARTRVTRRWVLASSTSLQYVQDLASDDDRRCRIVWEAPLSDIVGVESGSDDDDDVRVVFGVPVDETPRKWCKRHIPDQKSRVSCVVGLEVACLLRDGSASLPRRAAPNKALVSDGATYISNPQKGAKRSKRRLVLRGGCLYAYRDVNKSLGGRDTPELSRALILRDTFVEPVSRRANPPAALRPDERDRALLLLATEAPKLRAVRVRAASGAYLTNVLDDEKLEQVCLLFESGSDASMWLEALRGAAAPSVSSAPPGDAVALSLDCAGVPRDARRLLAARLRRGL